jgi:small GTP-binding protein
MAASPTINILLIGPPGHGKSTLINGLAGKVIAQSRGGNASCTLDCSIYEAQLGGTKFNLIDTPGFSATDIKPEIYYQTMKKIRQVGSLDAVWLVKTSRCTVEDEQLTTLFLTTLCGPFPVDQLEITLLANKIPALDDEELQEEVDKWRKDLPSRRIIGVRSISSNKPEKIASNIGPDLMRMIAGGLVIKQGKQIIQCPIGTDPDDFESQSYTMSRVWRSKESKEWEEGIKKFEETQPGIVGVMERASKWYRSKISNFLGVSTILTAIGDVFRSHRTPENQAEWVQLIQANIKADE